MAAPPGPGRTCAVAVYRPLAEQLADLAGARPGDRVLELSAGDGELTARLPAGVEVAVRPWTLSRVHRGVDVAVSLLALDSRDDVGAVLDDLERIAAHALVAVWTDGATHVDALRAAWRDVGGDETAIDPPGVDPAAVPSRWSRVPLADVARFDGVGQLLVAMTAEQGISVPGEMNDPLRERLAHHLARFTAADGTLRIPVRALLLSMP